MKNFTILVLSFVFVTATKAQFTPGQILVTGQVGFNESNTSQFWTSPNGIHNSSYLYTGFAISRFKNPLLLSGFGFSYSHNYSRYSDWTATSDRVDKSNTFQLYYTRSKLKSLAKNFYLSISGNAAFTYSHNDNKDYYAPSGNSGNLYGGELSGSLGLMYRIDKHFLTNVNVTNLLDLSYSGGYNDSYNPTQSNRSTQHQFGFETGFTNFTLSNIVFGISYLIK